MRKIFTLIAAAAMTVGASAQGYEGNKFFDNWSIGIEGGASTYIGKSPYLPGTSKAFQQRAFFKGMRPVAGVELTKMIIPAFGLAIQDHATFNWTDSKTAVDMNDIVLLAKVNFSNLFGGYTGKPRVFEVEGVFGGGFRTYFNHGCNYVDNDQATSYNPIGDGFSVDATRNNMIAKAGMNLLFNLGQKKAWSIAVKPAVVWDLDGFYKFNPMGNRFDKNNANFEITAGVIYHFKGSNGYHHFTKVRPYDQAEIDRLNANIRGLRNDVDDRDGRIRALEDELNKLRNQPPKTVEVVKTETITVDNSKTNTVNTESLNVNVHFPLGKSVITAAQAPNVEMVGVYLKNHPESKVVIRGYASKDGPEDLNLRLAKNRAAAVKNMLMSKYKIAEGRIDAQGNGISEMFSEPEWNRVSICTINVTD